MSRTTFLLLMALTVAACQSPVGDGGGAPAQNRQYLASLDGVQIPFELAIPSVLPGGYALATAPVVAEAATGNTIILLSFTDAGNGRTPRPVKICVSDDPATTDTFCPPDGSARIDRELGDAVIVIATDRPDGDALRAWADVDFQDLAEGEPAWVEG